MLYNQKVNRNKYEKSLIETNKNKTVKHKIQVVPNNATQKYTRNNSSIDTSPLNVNLLTGLHTGNNTGYNNNTGFGG